MDDPSDEYDEDDKTQLVDLDALQAGAAESEEPQFAPPPTMDTMPAVEEAGADDKTALFEIPSSLDGSSSGGGAITSSAPDYGSSSFGSEQNQHQQPPSYGQGQGGQGQSQGQGFDQRQRQGQGQGQGQQYQGKYSSQGQQQPPPISPGQNPQQPPQPQSSYGQQNQHQPPPSPGYGDSNAPPPVQSGNFSSVDSSATGDFGTEDVFSQESRDRSRDQVVIPGSADASHDGATAFVNIADFAEEKAHYTPEQQEAGYDGSTQFVDVNALMAGTGDDGGGGDPIDNDEDLHRGYQFSADDIQRGDEITLINAKNALGTSVILKRIWEGRPEEMTTPLRERIAQLHELKHSNLTTMNGMFVSDSGMWVELQATRGDRLTTILQQGGPLDPEQAIAMLSPVADVLDLIHDNELAYANLTTDAIWVDGQGNVLIEPFDMLKLEDRGNLGAFGPPEMDGDPESRQLSPESDVYSLAAVLAAAITGLPLQPQNLSNFSDQKLIGKLQTALAQNPADRPATAKDLIKSLQGGEGPDIKIVGAGIFAVLFLAVAVFAVMTGDDDDEPSPEAQAQQAEQEAESSEAEGDEEAEDDEEAALAEGAPEVELPGTINSDSRLTVTTSFQTNPPADAITLATDEQIADWHQQIDDLIEKADDASSDSDKLDYYSQALKLLGELIRTQEDPSEAWEMWQEVYAAEVIQDEVDEVVDSIRDALLDGRLGSANRRYSRLANIDPGATAHSFLGAHNSAEVIELQYDGEDDD